MISLEVSKYCENCEGFEPKVVRIVMESFDTTAVENQTIVKCESEKKCANMYRHIKREVENENARTFKCD